MYDEEATPPQDLHSEAWWVRLMDDDLTAEERARWDVHLWGCTRCQREWEAMAMVDMALGMAPPVPTLPPEFTAATVERIVRIQRSRRLLTIMGGIAVVGLVSLVIALSLGSVWIALDRTIGALLSARQVVFQSLVQTLVGLVLSWKALLPYIVGGTVVLYLMLMPHGVLITAALYWFGQRSRVAMIGADA